MDAKQLQEMMGGADMQKMLKENPDMMNKVNGFWKFLDNLADSSPEDYKKFIEEQMKDMKQDVAKEKEEEVKKQTIVSEPAFCMKALIARKVEGKSQATAK